MFLPLVGALRGRPDPAGVGAHLAKPVGLAVALVELGFVAYLVVDFQGGQAGFQFISQHSWISQFGISWKVGVDGISLFLVAMTALLFPVAMAGPTWSAAPGPSWAGCCCSKRRAWGRSWPWTCSCSS